MKTMFLQVVLVFALALSLPAMAAKVTVYKSPTCGCCKKWVDHMRENGFTVETRDVQSVVPYKIKHGVSQELASCHTAIVDGYVIEGHVPASDVKRLLKEKPKITGLAVPGMPVGSPGMEGNRKDAYNVISFDAAGNLSVYSRY
jgi:hypothetical protein